MQLRARQSVTLSETQNQQMTGFLPAAFVAAPAATRVLPPATSLQVVKSAVVQAVVHDCTKDALSFFTGIRTPSALIAGSSLAALFSMIKKYRDPNKTKAEKVTLRLFHACALFGYLLSVTTVIVSTAASTTLLLGGFNSKADSVYHFLKREMNFEFVLTRWCFFMGVLNFLVAMGGRVLIEFDLFAEYRKAERYVVFLALGGMIGHLISVINSSLNCWPNLFGMTLDVIQVRELACCVSVLSREAPHLQI